MPGVWWPITADRVCLSFTHRSTIHASAESPVVVAKLARIIAVAEFDGDLSRVAIRTACGVDAFVIAHGAGADGGAVLAAWPPPVEYRCPACAESTGVGGRQRHGCSHWLSLTGRDPRQIRDRVVVEAAR